MKNAPSGRDESEKTMTLQPTLKVFLIALTIFFSAELMASAEVDFEKGVTAFKSGDNESAVRYFESARNQGMDSVALRYNLASSYFKMERYDDAKAQFLLLLEVDAMFELASFNLGLIATRQKDPDAARD